MAEFNQHLQPQEALSIQEQLAIAEAKVAELTEQLQTSREETRLANERADKAEAESTIDSLTKLKNRRGLEYDKPTFEIDRKPVFFMAADLDHLKTINDQYGHDAGDKYILSFLEFCKIISRPDDGRYRLGGDEFLIAFKDIEVNSDFSPAIKTARILEALKAFNDENYFSKKPEERTIDHPLEFTFAIESTKPQLINSPDKTQHISESQRIEEINRVISLADKKEVELKTIKKAQHPEKYPARR